MKNAKLLYVIMVHQFWKGGATTNKLKFIMGEQATWYATFNYQNSPLGPSKWASTQARALPSNVRGLTDLMNKKSKNNKREA